MIIDTARPAGLAWICLPSPIFLLWPRLDAANAGEDATPALVALVALLAVPATKVVLAVVERVARGRFEASSH